MKITLLSICLVFTLSVQAQGKTFNELYKQELTQVKNLKALAYQYFKGPGSLPPGESLTPEMVTSKERLAQFYQIKRLIGLAIDAGIDIGFMEEFGIFEIGKGNYAVEFRKYPQWADLESLFQQLTMAPSLNTITHGLYNKGFTHSDIDALKHFLNVNNPDIAANFAKQNLIRNQQAKLKRALSTNTKGKKDFVNSSDTQTMVAIHKLIRKNRYDSWNSWGIDLLDLYPKAKQRILLAHLQENLGSMGIGKAPLNERYLLQYGSDILSGKELQRLITNLAELKTNTSKESK